MKQKPVDTRRDFEGLATLAKEIRQIVKPALGKRGFAGADILSCWDDLLGPDLAQGVRPEKLTFEKDSRINGTLHVKSAGGAFAMLFEHQKQRVIERLNMFFGYPAVAHIKITQGALKVKPLPQPKIPKPVSTRDRKELEKQVAAIEDPELRDLMYKIGLSRLSKR